MDKSQILPTLKENRSHRYMSVRRWASRGLPMSVHHILLHFKTSA